MLVTCRSNASLLHTRTNKFTEDTSISLWKNNTEDDDEKISLHWREQKTQHSGLLKAISPEGKPLAIRQKAALESQQINNSLAKANNGEKKTSKSNKSKTDFL